MEARYPLVAQTRYPGRLEAVTVYRFRVGTLPEGDGEARRRKVTEC